MAGQQAAMGMQAVPGKNMVECPHCAKPIGFQPMQLVPVPAVQQQQPMMQQQQPMVQ